jgi:integrase
MHDNVSRSLPKAPRDRKNGNGKQADMKLTMDSITALQMPSGKTEHFEWDDAMPGFGVRLRGSSKRWTVQYRVGKQQRRESLGDIRKVRLEDARKIARQRFAQVEFGNDPAVERAKSLQAATAAILTLGNVAARYLTAKEDRLRPNTYKQAKYHFAVQWKPFAGRPIDSLKRADVAAQLQEIIKKHGRTSAARARGNLSALFTWAMKEGLCETNPVIATNDPDEGILPRDRVLTDQELAAVWRACEDDTFGRIVRLLILTGCRREEMGSLKWSEVNLDSGVLTIPGDRTKNHRVLVLPLPPVAIEILQSTPRREERDVVFTTRGTGFSAWSYSKIALDGRITTARGNPLPRWVLHDLRRTMRTGLGKIGVQPHIAELAINHVKGGVQAIYDRHTYEREIKAALTLWANYVLSVVEDRQYKIVPLRA